jgi:hypothetical protein
MNEPFQNSNGDDQSFRHRESLHPKRHNRRPESIRCSHILSSPMQLCGREIRIQGRFLRIARIGGEKYLFLDDPVPILDAAKKADTRIDIFTFMQRLPDVVPKYPYPMELDNLAVLPVSTFEHWWTKQVDAKTRNMVRKAEKQGVTVRDVVFDDALVRGVHAIYNECPVRQGKPFPHYGKDLETVHREEGTHLDRSIFLGAYLGEKLIGFAKLVVDESRTQAGVMNFVSLIEHRDKAPTNALIAQAVRRCAQQGIPYLTYANFAYGRKERDSLADFKKNNGFARFDMPRYYVPLTPLGRIGLALGLHRKLIDRVPGSVWRKFRDLRAVWYNRAVRVPTKLSQGER